MFLAWRIRSLFLDNLNRTTVDRLRKEIVKELEPEFKGASADREAQHLELTSITNYDIDGIPHSKPRVFIEFRSTTGGKYYNKYDQYAVVNPETGKIVETYLYWVQNQNESKGGDPNNERIDLNFY